MNSSTTPLIVTTLAASYTPSFSHDYLPQLLYSIQGLMICFLNGLLFIAITFDKALRKRKELLIIAGLAFSEFIFGLGTLIIAIFRWLAIANGFALAKVSAWGCALTPQFFLQHIGQHMETIINVAISLERFVAVAYPDIYHKLDISKTMTLLILVAFSGLIDSAVVYLSIYFGSLPLVSSSCPTTVYPLWYATYFWTFISTLGLLSVLIYCAVFVVYRRSKGALSSNILNQGPHTAAQRRLTVTLGIICCSTLLLFTIPNGIYAWGRWTNTFITIGPLLGNMYVMNSIVNVMIYIARQRDIRLALMKLIRSFMKSSQVSAMFQVDRQLRLNCLALAWQLWFFNTVRLCKEHLKDLDRARKYGGSTIVVNCTEYQPVDQNAPPPYEHYEQYEPVYAKQHDNENE